MRQERDRNKSKTQMMSPYVMHSPSLIKQQDSQNETPINMNLTNSEDMNAALIQENNEMNEAVGYMQEEVTYLKLREKKFMYLIHLL
jgi:hypothetical protein